MTVAPPYAWSALAACRGEDPNIWHPPVTPGRPRAGRTRPDVAQALAVCHGCPVLMECRAWAVAHEPDGIWGGLTAGERQKLRRGQGLPPPPRPDQTDLKPHGTTAAYRRHLRQGETPCGPCRHAQAQAEQYRQRYKRTRGGA